MNRRKFLTLTGAGATGGVILSSPLFSQQLSGDGDRLLPMPTSVEALMDTGRITLNASKGKSQWHGQGIDLELVKEGNALGAYVVGGKKGIQKVDMVWKMKFSEQAKYLGDHWERTYGDVGWLPMNDFDIRPWYFMMYDGTQTTGIGVKTGPAAMCYWHVSPNELRLTLDVRNGSTGVRLSGRKLKAAALVMRKGAADETPFDATSRFCQMMCENPRLPKQPVYGINDWYYAYGNNSDEGTIRNCIYFSEMVTVPSNKPYCIIDGGWAKPENLNGGDYSQVTFNQLDVDERRFKGMPQLTDRIKEEGFRPGIWIRPFWALADDPNNITLSTKPGRSENTPQRILDPSIPESKERIASYFKNAIDWGFDMIKHDYATYDLFGLWGFEMLDRDFTPNGWHFHDQSKTSAEITLDAFRVIREASGDALLIGCNTISHLAAGLFELQRTGDDTSGREWARTKKMGINTLAFRLPQHRHFYDLDADCVGLTTQVPWELNKEWLDLLARSGTATFVSASTEALRPEVRKAIKEAFRYAAVEQTNVRPLDWMESLTPSVWSFDGKKVRYDWDSV